MRKRILSISLASVMLLASFVTSFAAVPGIGSIAVYEGNVLLEKAEVVLDELNYDAASGEWEKDVDYHAAQLAAIANVDLVIS